VNTSSAGRHIGAIALVVAALASPAFVPLALGQSPLATQSPDASADDVRIAQAVRTAIGNDSTLAGQAIKVASIQGAVVLSGRVRDGTHIKRAASLASRVPGVRKVTTSLTFTAPDTTLTSLPPGRIA
jgi:osmotically-inducible protein OsmY